MLKDDIRCRLSSRVNYIEQSFYQCKSITGQQYCIEVNDHHHPDLIESPCWHFTNIMDSCRPQYTKKVSKSSIIRDNKLEYINYIITNVLRQVVHHLPFDALNQLYCTLPHDIERILYYTDIDSDRLIRILVTEILQCYRINLGYLTDWYAFADSIKPLVISTK